jgi:hypothetical protein
LICALDLDFSFHFNFLVMCPHAKYNMLKA